MQGAQDAQTTQTNAKKIEKREKKSVFFWRKCPVLGILRKTAQRIESGIILKRFYSWFHVGKNGLFKKKILVKLQGILAVYLRRSLSTAIFALFYLL